MKVKDKDSRRIFIGGDSIGSSLSLATFMRYTRAKNLGGVIAINGPLPLTKANVLTNQITN